MFLIPTYLMWCISIWLLILTRIRLDYFVLFCLFNILTVKDLKQASFIWCVLLVSKYIVIFEKKNTISEIWFLTIWWSWRLYGRVGVTRRHIPNGFTFFVKCCWNTLQPDILAFVLQFFDSKHIPLRCNYSFVTLIPKMKNPLFIKDYRHITLIRIQYKVIVKLLSLRLAKVVDLVVSLE